MKNFVMLLLLLPNFIFGQVKTPPKETAIDTTPVEQVITAADVVTQQSRLSAVNNIMSLNTSSQMMYYDANDMKVKGSRFFHDSWSEGEVWFLDGMHVSKEYLYKFDEVDNTVILRDKKGNDITLESSTIQGCRMTVGGKSVVYFRGEAPNERDRKKIYQLVYNSDNYRVIKLPLKKLVTQQKTFHDDAMALQYNSLHRFYIKKKDGRYVEISLKKSDIMDALPEKKSALTRLFNKEAYKGRLNEGSFAQLMADLEKKSLKQLEEEAKVEAEEKEN